MQAAPRRFIFAQLMGWLCLGFGFSCDPTPLTSRPLGTDGGSAIVFPDSGLGGGEEDAGGEPPDGGDLCEITQHIEEGICVENVRPCAIDNGMGQQFWNGLDYDECMVVECNANFHIEGNLCANDIRACVITNGAGQQTWDGQMYGACVLQSCNQGYQVTVGKCTASLLGKFQTPCAVVASVDTQYVKNYIDDTKHDATEKTFGTADGGCRTPTKDVRQIGTYRRVGVSTSAVGVVEVDLELPQVEIILRTAAAVTDHNTRGVCGKKNWVINTPYTFTRATCGLGSGSIKTLSKVDANKLYMGNASGTLDTNGRPRNLDTDPKKIGIRQ